MEEPAKKLSALEALEQAVGIDKQETNQLICRQQMKMRMNSIFVKSVNSLLICLFTVCFTNIFKHTFTEIESQLLSFVLIS